MNWFWAFVILGSAIAFFLLACLWIWWQDRKFQQDFERRYRQMELEQGTLTVKVPEKYVDSHD
jgi:DNA-binding transcriptional regulator of glucitol operon